MLTTYPSQHYLMKCETRSASAYHQFQLTLDVSIDSGLQANMATATMKHAQTPNLTSNDAAVVSALFDHESPPSSSISISKTAPNLPHIPDSIVSHLQQREISAIRCLNNEPPPLSAIKKATSTLSHLISEHPKYAPAYLNRAQATRLLLGEENDLFTLQNVDLISCALSDLNKAISLASPSSAAEPFSDLQASLLSKAHTHRGYILLKASQVASQPGSAFPTELAEAGSGKLEEMASKDFFLAGRYGNEIARELSVKTNPYAKICGAIVQEAMRKEREEYAKALGGNLER